MSNDATYLVILLMSSSVDSGSLNLSFKNGRKPSRSKMLATIVIGRESINNMIYNRFLNGLGNFLYYIKD
ncbi:hypothetical protein [Alkaliphilus serpentinus]|uniref:hypothetical protein n=1 Tax=Alkaliphilus serpentinus TaxID=1482731 RepID=UPI0018656F23|nr:hypothetical protein [Alkaliphilus serpentinus]